MRAEDIPKLRSLDLFSQIGDSTFDAIVASSYLQRFPGQLELLVEGDPADFLYIVIDGSVELFAKTNGRESALRVVEPAEMFIVAAVLKDSVNLMSARTISKSELLLIPAQIVRDAIEGDPVFARSMVRELSSDFRRLIRCHKDIKLRPAVERLANRLLSYHRAQGENGVVILPYDKKLIASLLGMTAENLSRALNALQAYGVEVDGNRIKFTELDSLRNLAKPNPLIDL